MTRSLPVARRDLKRHAIVGGDRLVRQRIDLDGQGALGPVGLDDQFLGLLAVDESDGKGRERLSLGVVGRADGDLGALCRRSRRLRRVIRTGTRVPGRASRGASMSCTATSPTIRASPTGTTWIGTPSARYAGPVVSGESPVPSSGRRRRRTRQTARCLRSATVAAPGPGPAAFRRLPGAGPVSESETAVRSRPKPIFLDGAAADRTAAEPSERPMKRSTACRPTDRSAPGSYCGIRRAETPPSARGRVA